MKRVLISLALLCGFSAHAALTTAQIATLRVDILASELAAKCVPSGDGPYDIAAAYNLTKAPAFTVWKTNVSLTAVGDNFVGTELAGLTSLNVSRLQVIADYSAGGVNPSMGDRRAFFDDVFSGAGGALTRAKLLILWKRFATRQEALFAVGTGTDLIPATMAVEGRLSVADAILACTP